MSADDKEKTSQRIMEYFRDAPAAELEKLFGEILKSKPEMVAQLRKELKEE